MTPTTTLHAVPYSHIARSQGATYQRGGNAKGEQAFNPY
jgi:hypothetical protein